MLNVNILNVVEVPPQDLAMWLATNVLNIMVPSYGANSTINVNLELIPLMPDVANKIALTTELYVVVVGSLPFYSSNKLDMDKETRVLYDSLSKKKDILYRTIQSLESTKESISRIMTSVYESIRMSSR